MYEKLDITENTLKVLSLFTNGFDKTYYIREVERLLKISPQTSQVILEDLEKKGILTSKKRGKIKLFGLNINQTTKRYLIFTEQYKSLLFIKNNLLLKEIMEKISPYIKGIGLFFGSYVKGLQKKNSDLDLFVTGKCNIDKIKEISDTYGVKVDIKNYPMNIFKKNINRDIFLKEVLNNHIVFINAEQFVFLVLAHE
jgi:uncharacterized protein